MLYKLLGIVVWRGGKMFLRRRYGSYVPKPLIVVAVVAVAAVAAVAAGVLGAAMRNHSDE